MENNKTYRISASTANDNYIHVQLSQDVAALEFLSLKIEDIGDLYSRHTSNYGVIVGRVNANGGVGIPNARVSVFVKSDEDNDIYHFLTTNDRDDNGIRYNLLPDETGDECHANVGTFPNKRYMLDNGTVMEVYDKYYKYTARSNNAGDYMIFGVPTGSCIVHFDVDLSDIGIFSQHPVDMMKNGYGIDQFENTNQFKSGTDLNRLAQIVSRDSGVDVIPFWGDDDRIEVGLTRMDFNIPYKIEPTCVFIGSVVTDDTESFVNHKCRPDKKTGENANLIGKSGTIEMIRKTPNGKIEQFSVSGNQLIDENGTWCYQIPMNLDYVKTDEYGNLVPSDNPDVGIPTRASVRFRISLNDGITSSYHTARYLVPCNPELDRSTNRVKLIDDEIINPNGIDDIFEFGSDTRDADFRDMYWNKVYTVKSYIPRFQKGHYDNHRKFVGIKSTNFSESKNPFPYNRMAISRNFIYNAICVIGKGYIRAVTMINKVIDKIDKTCIWSHVWDAIKDAFRTPAIPINTFGDTMFGEEDDNKIFFPGIKPNGDGAAYTRSHWDFDTDKENAVFCDRCVVEKLFTAAQAERNDVISLDFYNDWVNGAIYMPRWYMKRIKKRRNKIKDKFCSCSLDRKNNRVVETNAFERNTDGSFVFTKENETYYNIRNHSDVYVRHGFIEKSSYKYADYDTNGVDGTDVYYYSPGVKVESGDGERDQFVRLFPTDIVLLGSLYDDDYDGIPKVYGYESTTSHIPPMAREYADVEDLIDDGKSTEGHLTSGEKVDIIETNGMMFSKHDNTCPGFFAMYNPFSKWDSFTYTDGLFVDLECLLSTTFTLPKTKGNLERICEIGVEIDSETYDRNDNEISADGFITSTEISDNDIRAMFATMNHLEPSKFYFSLKDGLLKRRTEYMYPVSFDGTMDKWVEKYTENESYDYTDKSYSEFRYGIRNSGDNIMYYLNSDDEGGSLEIENIFEFGGLNRYYTNQPNSFVVTENSFYFYFGIKEGATAMDRLERDYLSKCHKEVDTSLSIVLSGEKDSCCERYTSEHNDTNEIAVYIRNGMAPYNIGLYDDEGTMLYSGTTSEKTNYLSVSGDGGFYYVKVKDAFGEDAVAGISLDYDIISFDVVQVPKGTVDDGDYSDATLLIGNFVFDGEYEGMYSISGGNIVTFASVQDTVELTINEQHDAYVMCEDKYGEFWIAVGGISADVVSVTCKRRCNGDAARVCDQNTVEVNINKRDFNGITVNNVPMEILVDKPFDLTDGKWYHGGSMTPSGFSDGWYFNCDSPNGYYFEEHQDLIPNDYGGLSTEENRKNAYKLKSMFSMCDGVYSISEDTTNRFYLSSKDSFGFLEALPYLDYESLPSGSVRYYYKKQNSVNLDGNTPVIIGKHFHCWNTEYEMNVLYHPEVLSEVTNTNTPVFLNGLITQNLNGNLILYMYNGEVIHPSPYPVLSGSILGGYFRTDTDSVVPCVEYDTCNFPKGSVLVPESAKTNGVLLNEVGTYSSLYNPWFRVANVDRRMDFGLCFIKPVCCDSDKISRFGEAGEICSEGYLFIDIINGQEMAYNGSHEIISTGAASSNYMYWIHNGKIERSSDTVQQMNKRFYSAYVDIDGTSGSFLNYINGHNSGVVIPNKVVGAKISGTSSTIHNRMACKFSGNVVFPNMYVERVNFETGLSENNFSESNFETHRFAGLCHIKPFEKISLDIKSCSYEDPEIYEDSNNVLHAKVKSHPGMHENFNCKTVTFGNVESISYVYEYYESTTPGGGSDMILKKNEYGSVDVVSNVIDYGLALYNSSDVKEYVESTITTGSTYQPFSANFMYLKCYMENESGREKYVGRMRLTKASEASKWYEHNHYYIETFAVSDETVWMYPKFYGGNDEAIGSIAVTKVNTEGEPQQVRNFVKEGQLWASCNYKFNLGIALDGSNPHLYSEKVALNVHTPNTYGYIESFGNDDFFVNYNSIYVNEKETNLNKFSYVLEGVDLISFKSISARVSTFKILFKTENPSIIDCVSKYTNENPTIALIDESAISPLNYHVMDSVGIPHNENLVYGPYCVEDAEQFNNAFTNNCKYICVKTDIADDEFSVYFQKRGGLFELVEHGNYYLLFKDTNVIYKFKVSFD